LIVQDKERDFQRRKKLKEENHESTTNHR